MVGGGERLKDCTVGRTISNKTSSLSYRLSGSDISDEVVGRTVFNVCMCLCFVL